MYFILGSSEAASDDDSQLRQIYLTGRLHLLKSRSAEHVSEVLLVQRRVALPPVSQQVGLAVSCPLVSDNKISDSFNAELALP